MHILTDIIDPYILGAELIFHDILHSPERLAIIIIGGYRDRLESVVVNDPQIHARPGEAHIARDIGIRSRQYVISVLPEIVECETLFIRPNSHIDIPKCSYRIYNVSQSANGMANSCLAACGSNNPVLIA